MSESGAGGIQQRDRRRGEEGGSSAAGHAGKDGPCDCGCKQSAAGQGTAPEARPGEDGPGGNAALPVVAGPSSLPPGRREAIARRQAQSRSGKGPGSESGHRPGGPRRPDSEEARTDTQADSQADTKASAAAAEIISRITGTIAGSGSGITGAEPGTSGRVTGTEYLPRGEAEEHAGGATAAMKAGRSLTFRGGAVSGTRLGRSSLVTGNEPGACKIVTGNEYVGDEGYIDLCPAPAPTRRPAPSVSSTRGGRVLTGTLTGRSGRVTGDEPGSCEAVTGTPYVGVDQLQEFCDEGAQATAEARARPRRATAGARLTGLQPGISEPLTGAGRGACESVTGTPYLGKDQFESACGPEPGDDTPPVPGVGFSITPPARAAWAKKQISENDPGHPGRGRVTGPFGLGEGKVTGTEQFRFGGEPAEPMASIPPPNPASFGADGGSRVTGEGIDAGLRITGDDWDRGDRVTGTEGSSATVRNPTRRGGPMGAMPRPVTARPGDTDVPESRVTGGAGASARGALVTVSGGARG